jgi:MFS family permease
MLLLSRWGKPKTIDYVLWIICILYMILYIDRVNIGTAAGAIKSDLGLTNTELGLAFSAFAYPYAIIQLFGGWLGDRVGPRITLACCGVIFSAATILTGFVGGLTSLIAVRVLLGFGEAATFPTATRAMAIWTPAGKRGFAQGITHSFARVGSAITPPFIAFLITALSWRGSFIVAGFIGFLWVGLWLWYFRDNPADHATVSKEELEVLPLFVRSRAENKVPVRRLLKRMLPVTILDFCYAWTLWVYLSWLPSLFLQSYKLDLKNSALFAAGILFVGIIGDTLGGVISDRIYHRTGDLVKARRNVIISGLLGSLIFLIPVLLLKDIVVVSICLTLAFFCMELVIAPLWSVPMDIAPRYAGTASGFMNFGFGMAGIISPLVFGYIIDLTGNWHLPFAFSIGLLLVGVIMAFWIRPDRPFLEEPDAPDCPSDHSVNLVGPETQIV